MRKKEGKECDREDANKKEEEKEATFQLFDRH
jgi:hypothetical protein